MSLRLLVVIVCALACFVCATVPVHGSSLNLRSLLLIKEGGESFICSSPMTCPEGAHLKSSSNRCAAGKTVRQCGVVGECCDSNPQCKTSFVSCNGGKSKYPSPTCVGTTCTTHECCVMNEYCSLPVTTALCTTALNLVVKDLLPASCAGTTCIRSDCCNEASVDSTADVACSMYNPDGADLSAKAATGFPCPPTKILVDKTCVGGACTESLCCKDRGVCLANLCTAPLVERDAPTPTPTPTTSTTPKGGGKDFPIAIDREEAVRVDLKKDFAAGDRSIALAPNRRILAEDPLPAPAFCVGTTCTPQECCYLKAGASCFEFPCPDGSTNMYFGEAPADESADTPRPVQCCATNSVCGQFECDATLYPNGRNERTEPCVNIDCSANECCIAEVATTCKDYNCAALSSAEGNVWVRDSEGFPDTKSCERHTINGEDCECVESQCCKSTLASTDSKDDIASTGENDIGVIIGGIFLAMLAVAGLGFGVWYSKKTVEVATMRRDVRASVCQPVII